MVNPKAPLKGTKGTEQCPRVLGSCRQGNSSMEELARRRGEDVRESITKGTVIPHGAVRLNFYVFSCLS